MTGSMKQLDFGQTASLKKACLSGVRVFSHTSAGGAGALFLTYARSGVGYNVSLRSALFLESWELVTDLLKASAAAHAGGQEE